MIKKLPELVGIHLREEGYEVYKAYSGKEALKIFKQERIDLVILDVMMPVMDGNQVCSKIQRYKRCANHNAQCERRGDGYGVQFVSGR